MLVKGATDVGIEQTIKMSWHGLVFRIITTHQVILCSQPEQAVKETVELPVFETPWRSRDVITVYIRCYEFIFKEVRTFDRIPIASQSS